MDAIKQLTEDLIREEPHVINVGDTVKVHVKIKEGERSRIQVFEGTVIAKKHGGISETFTVRRTSYGVGVERVFPTNSPNVDKVEIVRHGKIRRAKLYYLRDRVGKAAKVKERIIITSKNKDSKKVDGKKADGDNKKADIKKDTGRSAETKSTAKKTAKKDEE